MKLADRPENAPDMIAHREQCFDEKCTHPACHVLDPKAKRERHCQPRPLKDGTFAEPLCDFYVGDPRIELYCASIPAKVRERRLALEAQGIRTSSKRGPSFGDVASVTTSPTMIRKPDVHVSARPEPVIPESVGDAYRDAPTRTLIRKGARGRRVQIKRNRQPMLTRTKQVFEQNEIRKAADGSEVRVPVYKTITLCVPLSRQPERCLPGAEMLAPGGDGEPFPMLVSKSAEDRKADIVKSLGPSWRAILASDKHP